MAGAAELVTPHVVTGAGVHGPSASATVVEQMTPITPKAKAATLILLTVAKNTLPRNLGFVERRDHPNCAEPVQQFPLCMRSVRTGCEQRAELFANLREMVSPTP